MADIASRRAVLGIVPKMDGPGADAAIGMAVVALLTKQLEGEMAECGRLESELALMTAKADSAHEMCEMMMHRAEKAERALESQQAAFEEAKQSAASALLAQARAEERATAAEAARMVAVEALAAERARPPTVQQAAAPATPPAPIKAWLLQSRDAQGNPRTVRMTPEY